ncbi:MAG: Na+/H+ antiporter subunit E [Hyphomicrobiaceae bacterium]
MRFPLRQSLIRALWFFGLWIIVAGANPSDLPVAALAVGTATWASFVLLPPRPFRISIPESIRLALRLLYQSVVAGIDVAARALHPQVPLNPGFVEYAVGLPDETQRDLFCTMLSLSPGTLPAGFEQPGSLLIHCLDVEQPVLEQIGAEEARLAHALGERLGDV